MVQFSYDRVQFQHPPTDTLSAAVQEFQKPEADSRAHESVRYTAKQQACQIEEGDSKQLDVMLQEIT